MYSQNDFSKNCTTQENNLQQTNPGVQNVSVRYSQTLVETIWFTGVTTIVCLIGIPTNVINCFVFWRQGLRDGMNLCLFSLAFVDIVLLVCTFTIYPVSSFMRFYDPMLGEEFYLKTSTELLSFLTGFRLTSGCITVVIAVERCLCVLYPLRAHALLKPRSAATIIFMCFILFESFYVTKCLMPQMIEIKVIRKAYLLAVPTQFYLENRTIIDIVFKTFLNDVVPIVIVVMVSVATSITVTKLRTALSWRKKSSSISDGNQYRQVALTKMLVIVSIVYVITMAPLLVREVSLWFLLDCLSSGSCNNIFITSSGIVFTFSQINSCFHFFIYFYHSSRFLLEFQKGFRFCYTSLSKPQ